MPRVVRGLAWVALTGAVACGGSPRADAPDAGAPAAEAPLPDSIPLLVLEREGGIAGASAELVLLRTGEVTLAEDPAPDGIPVRRWTAEPAVYQSVDSLLRSAEFRALEGEYMPANTCCDLVTYTITVPAAAGDRTIRTMDGAEQPAALVRLLERLRTIEAAAPR